MDQVALLEHSNCRPASVFVGQVEVDEGETVQIVGFRGRYRFGGQSQGVVVAGCRVVAQAFKGHLLLGHQLASRLVHLGVVDPKAAENRERLEDRYVRVREGRSIVL